MPTPVSYLSGASLSNTVGMFKRGTMAQNLKSSLESGYRWWNGIEVTSSQYLIYSDTYTMGTSTLANSIPVAWSTPDLTDQNLLNLINTLPPRVGQTAFTSLPIALQWLQSSNKFFLIRGGTENIVKSNLEVYLDAGRFDSYIGSGTTVNDLSGNGRNSTLANGASYNTSGVGSFLLDGTDDKLVGAAFTPNITNKTLCGWVKLSSVTQQGGGLINLQGEAGEPFDAIVYNETGLGWGFGSTGFARTSWSGVKETSTNQWVFMCATYANNNYNLYRNGVLILNTTSYNAYTYNFSCRVQMGERHTGGGGVFLAGNVACGMLYSKALSPEEVLQNFNAQKLRFGYYDNVQDGLIFNLDAGNYLSYPRSGTTWTDLTGRGNNGDLLNGTTFSGGTTPSIVFDGSDDYVNCINNTNITGSNPSTMEITCEFTSLPLTFVNAMMQIGQGSGHGNFRLLYLRYVPGETPQPRLSVAWYDSGFVTNFTPIQNQIYTFTYTDNGSNESKLYINGSLLTTYTSYTALETNTNGLYIGRFSYGGVLSGKVYNTKIYNRVLTPQEVIQNFESQRVNFGITGITTNGLVLNLDAANTASYGGSGTVWRDISGGGNDGILTNGPTYSNSGASSSIVFDGADDFINLGNTGINIGTGDMSVSIWVKVTAFFGINAFFYSIGSNQSGFYGLGCTLNGTPFFATTPGGQIVVLGSAGSITANNWCNLVGTRINGTIRLYLNGSQTGTPVTSSGVFNTTNAKIGTNADASSEKLQGNSSLFMLYNVGLTDSQVLQNYNAQKSRFGL
jgi:hypothetical protein